MHDVVASGAATASRMGPRAMMDGGAATARSRALLGATAVTFTAIAAPLVWRGAPLADDFNNCVAPMELGLGGFMAVSWQRLGAIRPARFLEILVTGSICGSLPFGLAIAISLACTLAVAWLVRQTLIDLRLGEPWANAGAALWLLQPLGTEAALWPAALHVPAGLALTLGAIRFYLRGRLAPAALLNAAAVLSVEQVILALPFAAWLVSPRPRRLQAAALSAAIAAAALIAFTLWPGDNPRLHTGVAERLRGLVSDPAFYAGYPAVGLGLHSIPLAIRWALPWSVLLLLGGALVGRAMVPRAPQAPADPSSSRLVLLSAAGLAALANVLVALAVPQQGSPRVFTPTWLILAIVVPALAASVAWRRPRLAGTAAGIFAAGAVLSLMLSVAVRLQNAAFTAHAAEVIGARAPAGSQVALCGVRRSAMAPAPRGGFAVHDFVYPWAAERALRFYTGKDYTVHLSGELWRRPCPPTAKADLLLSFDELAAEARR